MELHYSKKYSKTMGLLEVDLADIVKKRSLTDELIDEGSPKEDSQKIIASQEAQEQPSEPLDLEEKIKLGLQGLLFNFSDEGIAAVKSLFTDQSYDEAVAAERKILEEAREKDSALAYELGGALVPSLAAIVLSGGTGTPAVVANLARISVPVAKTGLGRIARIGGVGAGEGFVAGAGAAEGDVLDRVTDTGTLISAATGGAARPVIQGTLGAGKKIVGKVADRNFTRKILSGLGKAESAELNRIIEETGLSVDDVIRRVGEGEVIGDMADSAATALRALYSKAGKGREGVAETLSRRSREKTTDAKATMQRDLSPEPILTAGEGGVRVPTSGIVEGTASGIAKGSETGNILKYFGAGIKRLKRDEGKAYDKIFAQGIEPSNELNEAALEILTNQRSLRKPINDLMAASGKPPLFKINPETKVLELTRDVDLETGEIIRRALSDSSSAAYRGGQGAMGEAVGNLESGLRRILDDASPDLKSTRAAWAAINASADAFDQGRKILTKSADDAEVIFEDLVAKGDMDAVASFRLGYATALRNKSSAGNVTTLFRNLSDVGRKERQILEIIYPGDSLEEAVKKIDLADAANRTRNRVLGGSPTAPQMAAERKIGTASSIANLVEIAMFPLTRGPIAAMRFIKDAIGKKSENLTPEQMTQIAKMLVEEDPVVLAKALRNDKLVSGLATKYNSIADSLISGSARAATVTAAPDIQSGKIPRSISSIAETMDAETRRRVLEAVADR